MNDTSVISEDRQLTFREQYDLDDKIGQGAYSVVKLCIEKSTGDKYAVKIVSKLGLSIKEERELRDEVNVMKSLNHPYVVHLIAFFDEPRYFYMVLEYLPGGELFDRLVARERYSEDVARHCVRVICSGIQYIHKMNIVHRDIKPENLLLTSLVEDDSVKICDFGLAAKYEEGKLLRTACGTPGYLAPEILKGTGYGKPVDMWAIGVVTYCLLCGYPPFGVEDRNKLYKSIMKCDYHFDEDDWKYVSEEAKSFVEMLLEGNMYRRMTADDALEHPWMKLDDGSLSRRDLTPRLEQLKSYQSHLKFKAAATVIMATNKLTSLIADKKMSDGNDEGNADSSNEESIMFSPPTRVLEELEEHAISRTNSKTLSARIPKSSSRDRGGLAMAIRHLGSGVFKSGSRCKEEAIAAEATAILSPGSARPGILHIGSGICRIGSSRSRDSSPRHSVGTSLSGESNGSGTRERSRSAMISGEAYRALNMSFRSRDGYSNDSFERDDSKSGCVSISGSAKNIWEDEDIVGAAAARHNTSVADGMMALLNESQSPSKAIKTGKPRIHSTRKSVYSSGEELEFIAERTSESCKSPKSSPKPSPRERFSLSPIKSTLTIGNCDPTLEHPTLLCESGKNPKSSPKPSPRERFSPSPIKSTLNNDLTLEHPTQFTRELSQGLGTINESSSKSSTKSNDSKKIPVLKIEQIGGITHLPDLNCPAPMQNGIMLRIANKRSAKTSSPPRCTAISTASASGGGRSILPSIGISQDKTIHTRTHQRILQHAATVEVGSQIKEEKVLEPARPYVTHSSTVSVGSTGHDLPKELHGEDCHNSDNTSSDKVQAQHVVAKKKKRFKGFRIRV